MNAKVCLLLAVGLLLGALASGNPFLSVPMRAAAPASVPPQQPVIDLGAMTTPTASAVPAVFQPGVAPQCPDASLDPLVDRVVRLADGSLCWVLVDGRRCQQDPAHPERVILVPVAAASGPASAGPERDSHESPR